MCWGLFGGIKGCWGEFVGFLRYESEMGRRKLGIDGLGKVGDLYGGIKGYWESL